jgi:hypothetical protein
VPEELRLIPRSSRTPSRTRRDLLRTDQGFASVPGPPGTHLGRSAAAHAKLKPRAPKGSPPFLFQAFFITISAAFVQHAG